jgi:FdhE protein
VEPSVQRYVEAFPRHAEQLLALQRILDFQAHVARRLEPGPAIAPGAARDRWQEGRPLLTPSVPSSALREALEELRPLLPAPARGVLDRLRAANVEATLPRRVEDIDAGIRGLAQATSTDADEVAGLLRIVLAPFFTAAAAPTRTLVDDADWRRGSCPICGSSPFMARLAREDGRRHVACGLCGTEWRLDRLCCPFCERADQPGLRYFTVDDDAAHRVECCDACRRYIKTVDERVSVLPTHLPAEDVITSHLDALALEQGYV